METYTLKDCSGRLYGISNETAQPGKTLSIYDGDILILTTPLKEAFPDPYPDTPGMVVDRVITKSLRVETDGGALKFYGQWSKE